MLRPTGTVLQPAGTVLQPAGIVLQPAGIVLQIAGIVLRKGGDALEIAGDAHDWFIILSISVQKDHEIESGIEVKTAANFGSPEDAHNTLEYGTEGIGLLRTEFLT